jgi:hypothetical protein
MNIASRVARVALATATAVVATLSASPQQPQFSTQIEHVRVDVLVSNRGRPVTGLRPADFEILDNGVPQRVEFASFDEIPLNVIIVLDASFAVMMLAESDVGRALQIIFSDGLDVSSWLKSDAMHDSAKRSKAVVYAVSAGRPARSLNDLSSWTGGSVVEVESTKSLNAPIRRNPADVALHRPSGGMSR